MVSSISLSSAARNSCRGSRAEHRAAAVGVRVHVVEHLARVARRRAEEEVAHARGGRFAFGLDLREEGIVDDAALAQRRAESPRQDPARAIPSASSSLRYRVVSSAVVCASRRYVTASISVGPSPRRARSTAVFTAPYTEMTSLPSTRMPGMPTPARAQRDRRRPGLQAEGNADRVAVVLDDEHHRRGEDGGQVERLVGVTLAGGPVAEEGERDDRVVLDPRRHRQADRMQRLRGQRRGQRRHPVLVGVESAVPAPREEREQTRRRQPRGRRCRPSRDRSGRASRRPRARRPHPTCAASWPWLEAKTPSAPWRVRLIAWRSTRRLSAIRR